MRRVSWTMFLVLALTLTHAQRTAHAGILNGSVTLDTSGLSGTFELGFVLIDGSATDDANNAVTLSNFAFGSGGSAGAVDTLLTTAGASGDFSSGATLIDSEFLNVFAETFTAGELLTFDLGTTTNVDAGATPDQLSIVLFQGDGTPIPSSDPSGALLLVNIDSAHPALQTFPTELTAAPTITFPAKVPEPPTHLLFALALSALWVMQRGGRRSRRR